MIPTNGSLALIVLAVLAALIVGAITFLAAIGAEIPVELTAGFWILISAAAGGGVVKGADVIDKRAAELRKLWAGDK